MTAEGEQVMVSFINAEGELEVDESEPEANRRGLLPRPLPWQMSLSAKALALVSGMLATLPLPRLSRYPTGIALRLLLRRRTNRSTISSSSNQSFGDEPLS